MKLTFGQWLSLAIAVGFAVLVIIDAPFIAAAREAGASSQVVFGALYDPPVIAGAPGKLDFPLLLLELAFVAFVGGAIFFAASQNKPEKKRRAPAIR